jgi:hypothetical protein|tara:strand:+ start:5135 stop:5329 length:195 start_codon:yes stop_codon:yes gene_type:complete
MTLCAPPGTGPFTGKTFRGLCKACDNDTFYLTMGGVTDIDAQIVGVECAMCGDETELVNMRQDA